MYQCKSIYVPVKVPKRISIDQQLLTRMPLIYLYLYEICHVNSLVPSFPVIRVIPMTRRES